MNRKGGKLYKVKGIKIKNEKKEGRENETN